MDWLKAWSSQKYSCIIPAPNFKTLFIDEMLTSPPTLPHFNGVRFITFRNSARQMVFLNILTKSWEREDPHSGWNKITTFPLNNYGLAKESKVAKGFKSFTFSARYIIACTDIGRPKP